MSTRPTARLSVRALVIAGTVLVLVLAGVVSGCASSHPDGLEFVAGRLGFHSSAQDSAAAASPLAHYGVSGVENARVSGGLSGVIGVLVVAAIMAALVWLLRRAAGRRDEQDS